MKFKEYLEIQEFIEIDNQLIDEGLMSALGGAIDAGISSVGTTGKQLARGVYNTGVGGARTISNVAGSVLGSEKSRKKSMSNLPSSIGQMSKGIIQTAAAPLSGAIRGIEAGRNPFGTIKADSGLGVGSMLGIRSKQQPQQQPQQQNSSQTPSWQELVAKYKTSKDQEKLNVVQMMKQFHGDKYEKVKKEQQRMKQQAKQQNYQPMKLVKNNNARSTAV